MRESVEITMLGKFTIFGPGMAAPKAVSLTGRARRLWILTAYLILNRERGVSARELIDLLWPDSESSDPMATLQNNISRARNALEELGLRDGKKLICNRSGTYYWAPNTETVLDCEQFRTALRACLDEVGQICRRVLGLDPAAEEFAVRLMQALTRSGMPDKALEYYDYISKLYLETYAVPPSQELEAEKAIAVQQRYGGAVDENQLAAFLAGPQQAGAFRCDNSVFREMARRQLRTMERTGEKARLLMVELQNRELPGEKRAQLMRRMELTILESLRMGDPFTRMGADCILIMLAGADDNGAAVVEKRVCRNYRQTYSVPASAFVFRSMDLKRLGQKMI